MEICGWLISNFICSRQKCRGKERWLALLSCLFVAFTMCCLSLHPGSNLSSQFGFWQNLQQYSGLRRGRFVCVPSRQVLPALRWAQASWGTGQVVQLLSTLHCVLSNAAHSANGRHPLIITSLWTCLLIFRFWMYSCMNLCALMIDPTEVIVEQDVQGMLAGAPPVCMRPLVSCVYGCKQAKVDHTCTWCVYNLHNTGCAHAYACIITLDNF